MIIDGQESVTKAVLSELARADNPRFKEVMSALVSSTSPQVGHEALMVVTAAIPFPHRWVMKASALLAKCLTGQNGTLPDRTSPHRHKGQCGR